MCLRDGLVLLSGSGISRTGAGRQDKWPKVLQIPKKALLVTPFKKSASCSRQEMIKNNEVTLHDSEEETTTAAPVFVGFDEEVHFS